jgi:aminobenzoyl-glutamate transport protein
MNDSVKPKNKRSWIDQFLKSLEWAGNLLPHPVTLFALFAILTVLLSGVGNYLEWSVADPRGESFKDRSPDGMIRVVSLMSPEGLRRISANLVRNFTDFAPLGTVLVALLGVGLAEHSGLLSAAIRSMVFGVRRELVTVAVVFAGIMSNTASEIGYIVLIPLGAAIYYSLGRHPLAGLAAAFAGVSGGYSANLLLGTIDPLLAGLTTEAAGIWQPGYLVSPACNWYFMMASTFVLTIVGSWISIKIIEPRLGAFDLQYADRQWLAEPQLQKLSGLEVRGLTQAIIAVVAMIVGMLYLCWPIGTKAEPTIPGFAQDLPWFGALGFVEDPKKGPAFLNGIVTIIFVFFLVPGLVFGRVVGTIRNDKDIIQSMTKSMTSLGSYIVLVFFAAQFVKFFEWTNLGTLVAISGAQFIKDIGMDNPAIFVLFIMVCASINLIMGSASAKWTFMAPVFVPMMMQLGYSPELIQCAYRIGDSCTNVISPMMSYFGMIFVFACRYDRRFGMGSIISLMFPYAVIFLITWTAFFYLWVFVLHLPIGPGTPIFIDPATGST